MTRLLLALLLTLPMLAHAGPVLRWGGATATHPGTGRVMLYRVALTWDPAFKRSAYPHRITISWRYNGSNGMPLKEDHARMDRLEDLLAPAVEETGLAILPIVRTGEDRRIWVYYARSKDAFTKALNSALKDEPQYPIEIEAEDDPAWSTYQQFRDGLRNPEAQTNAHQGKTPARRR